MKKLLKSMLKRFTKYETVQIGEDIDPLSQVLGIAGIYWHKVTPEKAGARNWVWNNGELRRPSGLLTTLYEMFLTEELEEICS